VLETRSRPIKSNVATVCIAARPSMQGFATLTDVCKSLLVLRPIELYCKWCNSL
jgi:hypothetical protein